MIRIASAAWPIDRHADWKSYAVKLETWVTEAAGNGARLLVFPEYGNMELASLLDPALALDAAAQVEPLAAMAGDIAQLHADLARRHKVHILAGSTVERDELGRIVNRARLFGPDGGAGFQDKLVLTMWERTHWTIAPGAARVTLFDLGFARVGVIICYDSEFPDAAQMLAAAGADILLVPSCTDSLAGYWRVRIGAMARALETQCFVVQSPTVGAAPWSAVVDVNVGAAGVFAPPDLGMPANGIVALGELDAPGWTYADLDLDALAKLRRSGAVRGPAHWGEQPQAPPLRLQIR
ncbi:carbon-nitrogen hydrolase family protein [Sphingopyxis sp.]|uniref:carbon-nitrogen hydrolase family protein n=1 Tax=Sphingopyxis sp. TaxID=1908224 RepID=UPI002ED82A38